MAKGSEDEVGVAADRQLTGRCHGPRSLRSASNLSHVLPGNRVPSALSSRTRGPTGLAARGRQSARRKMGDFRVDWKLMLAPTPQTSPGPPTESVSDRRMMRGR